MRLPYQQLKQLLRPEVQPPYPLEDAEETLVADARAGLTPSDMVERRLVSLLRETSATSSPLSRESHRLESPDYGSGRGSLGAG